LAFNKKGFKVNLTNEQIYKLFKEVQNKYQNKNGKTAINPNIKREQA
jgi:hypothetical protein